MTQVQCAIKPILSEPIVMYSIVIWPSTVAKHHLQYQSSRIISLTSKTCLYWAVTSINPLNPKIKNWILICCPYSFPTELEERSMIKYQANSSCMIMSVILMTTPFYKALILQGEIWCWSLLGLKGLSSCSHPFRGLNKSYTICLYCRSLSFTVTLSTCNKNVPYIE